MKTLLILFLIFVSFLKGADTMKTVEFVDLENFMGKWFVIALVPNMIEKGATISSDTYALNNDGTIDITYDAIKDGAAGSWQFINRYKTINKNKFDFGFSSELMEKDLRYVLKQSANNRLDLKLTKNVHKRYKKLLTTEYRNQDTSSLIKSFLK